MSTASAKTHAQKKVQRQKRFIVVGSVVLLVILGFEMTKMLSHGGQEATPSTPPATSSSVPGSTTSSSGWKLPDTDRIVVQRTTGQLLSFGLFGSKDPFVQQLSDTVSSSVPPTAAAPATVNTTPATSTTTTPSQPGGVVVTPATSPTPAPSGSSTPQTAGPAQSQAPPQTTTPPPSKATPQTAPGSVLISTNGVCETVALKGTFPHGSDIFEVVSIAHDGKSVEIGVVGGSYDSGRTTATLKLGEKLTLVNTGDGTRYVIQLRSRCDATAQPAPVAGTSPPSSPPTQSATPVPPAPTTATITTATTPIVPDSLDPTTTTPTG